MSDFQLRLNYRLAVTSEHCLVKAVPRAFSPFGLETLLELPRVVDLVREVLLLLLDAWCRRRAASLGRQV